MSQKMVLDEELNDMAEKYALKLAKAGKQLKLSDHDPTLHEIGQGENIGQVCATDKHFPFEEVTDSW